MHRQHTPARRYSLPRVFALAALLTLVVTGTVTTTSGLTYDWRHVVGLVLGLILIGRIVVDLLVLVGAPVGEADPDTAYALRAVEVANTASWRRHGAQHPALVIRHNPLTGAYHVRGEIAGVVYLRSIRWQTPSRLYLAIIDAEAAGLIPDSDEGTRVVRARLGLPEWVDPHAGTSGDVAGQIAARVPIIWTQR